MNKPNIFTEIAAERVRQENLAKEGRFNFTAANPGLTHAERLPMLAGELGEIATQIEQQPDSGLMPVTHAGQFDQAKAETGSCLEQDGKRKPHDPTAGTREGLRTELIQLAAIAVAWVQAIDGEGESAERWGSRSPSGEWIERRAR